MLSFSEYTQLDELTRQARLKMSRAARRTAKLRARKRMMRRKRRKSGEQLKLKAAKAARGMFKTKFLRGRQWSDLSYSERDRIDKRIKKIPGRRLKAIANKLLPGVRKAERERIMKLRDVGNKPGDIADARDYDKEYKTYHSKPEQRANRSKRVLARRKLERQGKVKKGDGKDVDHADGNPQNNADSNLRVMDRSKNRGRNNN